MVRDNIYEVAMDEVTGFIMTPERIREIAHNNFVTSGPGVNREYMPTQNEVETILSMVQYAVEHGQIIDFGYWPNDMIKDVARRSGRMYAQGALMHPFSSPYIILHSWDDKENARANELLTKHSLPNEITSAYLVNPFPNADKSPHVDFEAMTFEGLVIKRQRTLAVADRVIYYADQSASTGRCCCDVIPMIHRFARPGTEDHAKLTKEMGYDLVRAAAANVLDPIMVALTLLNTRGVTSHTVEPSAKLARSRHKAGKPPIPSYRRVDSQGYVTALLARYEPTKREALGGTHASPVFHVRMGHWRHYASGERSFIRDTLVNATPEMRQHYQSGRSHYVVKP